MILLEKNKSFPLVQYRHCHDFENFLLYIPKTSAREEQLDVEKSCVQLILEQLFFPIAKHENRGKKKVYS